jgi:ribosomal protein S18 acetylase RimI-like enzyme
MAITVEPATADLPSDQIADLLWSTDPELWTFLFGTINPLRKVLAYEWPAKRALLSHAFTSVVRDGDTLSGLCTGYSLPDYEANFALAVELQAQAFTDQEAQHLTDALYWMDRLFPTPREHSFYIMELAVAEQAQGSGLARLFLDDAEHRARAVDCTRLSLDVAAKNDAVAFYRHLGFKVEIETRVPFLADHHGIGTHLHMTRSLDGSGR